jgi:hypothetical protein
VGGLVRRMSHPKATADSACMAKTYPGTAHTAPASSVTAELLIAFVGRRKAGTAWIPEFLGRGLL